MWCCHARYRRYAHRVACLSACLPVCDATISRAPSMDTSPHTHWCCLPPCGSTKPGHRSHSTVQTSLALHGNGIPTNVPMKLWNTIVEPIWQHSTRSQSSICLHASYTCTLTVLCHPFRWKHILLRGSPRHNVHRIQSASPIRTRRDTSSAQYFTNFTNFTPYESQTLVFESRAKHGTPHNPLATLRLKPPSRPTSRSPTILLRSSAALSC